MVVECIKEVQGTYHIRHSPFEGDLSHRIVIYSLIRLGVRGVRGKGD
jgi:hypothetical protein